MPDDKKKKVDLDKLIEDLNPEKINEEIGMQHTDTRNKHKIDNIKAESWDDFKNQITGYVQYHHKKIYKADLPDEIAYAKAKEILDEMTDRRGNKIGFLGAYEMARKGKLPKVIDQLADAFEAEHIHAYNQHVMEQIDPLDFDQHVELVKQYRGKYEKFLPEGMKKKSDEEIARHYQALIRHHSDVVGRIKEHLEKYNAKVEKYKPKED